MELPNHVARKLTVELRGQVAWYHTLHFRDHIGRIQTVELAENIFTVDVTYSGGRNNNVKWLRNHIVELMCPGGGNITVELKYYLGRNITRELTYHVGRNIARELTYHVGRNLTVEHTHSVS